MKLVDAHVAEAPQRRRVIFIPSGGLGFIGVEVGDPALGSVQCDVDGIGIAGDIRVHRGVGRNPYLARCRGSTCPSSWNPRLPPIRHCVRASAQRRRASCRIRGRRSEARRSARSAPTASASHRSSRRRPSRANRDRPRGERRRRACPDSSRDRRARPHPECRWHTCSEPFEFDC